MGIYTKGKSFTESASYVEPIECELDDLHEAALQIVAESDYNFNMLMKALLVEEFNTLESTGAELIYESGNMSAFFEKIKSFFMNILAKIKGLWNRFVQMFDSMTKSGKEFANKYKKEIYGKTGSIKDFTYKGYTFDGLTGEGKDGLTRAIDALKKITGIDDISQCTAAKEEDLANLSEDAEDKVYEPIRGAVAGVGGSLTSSEFTKELKEKFYGGTEKEELEITDIGKYYDVLVKDSESDRAKAKRAFEQAEKVINDQIKALDKKRDEILRDKTKIPGDDGSKEVRAVSIAAGFLRQTVGIGTTYNGVFLKAIKDRVSQAKSICISYMHYKPKNESTWNHESYEGGFLSDVSFK